ncbi:hypothetical protein VTL71DRAFT_5546 [Oculimacula yallundae]|uniref:Uncharacterized protein n=1 Tax=Oculimacula yallundae TaxID=86028 RepID=A0ABR4C2K7_9HELO
MTSPIITPSRINSPTALPLSDLSPEGRTLPKTESPSTGQDISLEQDITSEPRDSISSDYDGEPATAKQQQINEVRSANSFLKVHWRRLTSNKLARRTLAAAIIFGIFNIVYQNISLGPAFMGANAAVQAARDGKHNIAYVFLKECASRKAQSLPLGQDCAKYLLKTPKAPADIDDWMEDASVPNTTTSTSLAVRSTGNSTQGLAAAPLFDFRYPDIQVDYVICALLLFAVTLLILAYFLRSRSSRRKRNIKLSAILDIYRYCEKHLGERFVSRIVLGIALVGAVLLVYCIYDLYMNVVAPRWRWKAAKDFVDSCRQQAENDLPLGKDCIKYTTTKILKSQPRADIGQFATMIGSALGIMAIVSVAATVVVRKRAIQPTPLKMCVEQHTLSPREPVGTTIIICPSYHKAMYDSLKPTTVRDCPTYVLLPAKFATIEEIERWWQQQGAEVWEEME